MGRASKRGSSSWLRLPMETHVLIHLATKAEEFRYYPVSKAVSNWRNDGPSLVEPVEIAPGAEQQSLL